VVRDIGCPSAPKSVEHMITGARNSKSASTFSAEYIVNKKAETERNASIQREYTTSALTHDNSKDFKNLESSRVMSKSRSILAPRLKDPKKVAYISDDILKIDDYMMYLNNETWDFLLHVIIDERAETMNKQKQYEELERLEKEKAKKMLKDKAFADKYERKRAMTEFVPGSWNLGVLTLIEENYSRDVTRVALYKRSKERRQSYSYRLICY